MTPTAVWMDVLGSSLSGSVAPWVVPHIPAIPAGGWECPRVPVPKATAGPTSGLGVLQWLLLVSQVVGNVPAVTSSPTRGWEVPAGPTLEYHGHSHSSVGPAGTSWLTVPRVIGSTPLVKGE